MAAMVLLVALVPIVAADLRWRIVPDLVVAPAFLAAWVLSAMTPGMPWWGPVATAAIVGGVLAVPAVVRPDGMGMGDVKLAALIGASLGAVPGLAALLAGLVTAAAWGLLVARRRGVGASAVALPLAPFLAAGVLAVVGPSWFVHSARASGHGHHASAQCPVRPPPVGGWIGRRHASLARARAADGASRAGGARPCGSAPAPRWASGPGGRRP
jgi:leader peptidase (prepilin peptidase)/N-methyltransferase